MNIVSLGNSFSCDAQRYLHDLAKSRGTDIQCVNLFIGGCSLERQYRELLGDRRSYIPEFNGHYADGFFVSLREALTARSWDYITVQQASHYSCDYSTYEPYLSLLAAEVRRYCPGAKLLIHQTWGYEAGSDRLKSQGFATMEEMTLAAKGCYAKAAQAIGAEGILPCGEVFLEAKRLGCGRLHRDTFHASYGLGRFLLALTWYGCLTGDDVRGVSFRPFDEEVPDEELALAREAVATVLARYGK